MEKIAQGRGQETNTAQGEAKYCIWLETTPGCYFFILNKHGSALTGSKCFLVVSVWSIPFVDSKRFSFQPSDNR